MPELPEVEVLVRHLRPLLRRQQIHSLAVRRSRFTRPTPPVRLQRTLLGSRFIGLRRRGKYMIFTLSHPAHPKPVKFLAHLGMTGRIYLQSRQQPIARHAAVVIDLHTHLLVFEDTRYFGRLTLDLSPLLNLGPEPLSAQFTTAKFARALRSSRQSIKVRLLDQSLVAGIGNIYASEALFLAQINPRIPAAKLDPRQVAALRRALRSALTTAIRRGSTVPLDWAGSGARDGFFYYGRSEGARRYIERLRVYDRAGKPCPRCRTLIRRITQANRSTYFCPACQRVLVGRSVV